MKSLAPVGDLENRIYLIRGQKVMLDQDLAMLYGVKTKELNKAVKRNMARFPADFAFQLNDREVSILRFQFGTSSWGGRRYRPLAFTEQGLAMLSSVLRSPRAIQVNIAIMRTFVKLRETLALHKELAVKLAELERRIMGHDVDIKSVFEALEELRPLAKEPPKGIGFRPEP